MILIMRKTHRTYPICTESKSRLGININSEMIIIIRDKMVHDKKIPATEVRRYRYFRCTGKLGAQTAESRTA